MNPSVNSQGPMGVVGPPYTVDKNNPQSSMQLGQQLGQMQMPHSNVSYGLVPDPQGDMIPMDMDDGSNPFAFMNIPFIGDSDNAVEPQLLELLGMVMNMQSSLVQYMALLTLGKTDPRQHEIAMRKVQSCRKSIVVGNKKLMRVAAILQEERKNRGIPAIPAKPPSLPMQSQIPSKRGRGRLQKCEKHRRWKKRCPMDCPDKPMTAMYDEIDELDEELGGQDDDFKDMGVSSSGLLPPMGPPQHARGLLGTQMMPSHMNLNLGHLTGQTMRPMHPGNTMHVNNSGMMP